MSSCTTVTKYNNRFVCLLDNKKSVEFLITVDDIPNEYTKVIAETINRYGYRCIYFVTGNESRLDYYKNLLKYILITKNDFGDHTRSHSLSLYRTGDYNQIYDDIKFVQDYFLTNFRYKMTLFRAPYNVSRVGIIPDVLNKLNLRQYRWDIELRDCFETNYNNTLTEYILRKEIEKVIDKEFYVVILHSNKYVFDNLPAILDLLSRYGKIISK